MGNRVSQDIFEFWSQIDRGVHIIHPADKRVFDRMRPKKHGFRLGCLPACFTGALRDAPVVLLYLSPGFGEQDVRDAKTNKGKDYYAKRWRGREPMRATGPGVTWMKGRTKPFGDYEIIRKRVAVLNLGAYHSTNVSSFASLLALPSSRVSLGWAQDVLFPDVEAGKRVVICMRSASYWGLEQGQKYKGTLRAKRKSRGGAANGSRSRTARIPPSSARCSSLCANAPVQDHGDDRSTRRCRGSRLPGPQFAGLLNVGNSGVSGAIWASKGASTLRFSLGDTATSHDPCVSARGPVQTLPRPHVGYCATNSRRLG
jgi:hypothetical protein